MSDNIDYKNNPLHGVGLKTVLTEIVGQYGFNILFAYLNINCFKTNASIDSSMKFLKKTDWAREKVEAFYLYDYKNLPRPPFEEFPTPVRERIIPKDQITGSPRKLSLEEADHLREKRENSPIAQKHRSSQPAKKKVDPWAADRKKYS